MSHEIVVRRDNSQLVLNKSKQLLNITRKILSNNLVVDEPWMQRLWAWAAANEIDDYKFITGSRAKEMLEEGSNVQKSGLERPGFDKLSDGFYNGIPTSREKLQSLAELFLINYGLEELPPGIGNLTALTALYLYNNAKIGTLPPGISNLKELTYLDIKGGFDCSYNNRPPDGFDYSHDYDIYDLHHDQYHGLYELPPEIGNLTKLAYLDLSDNGLWKLPAEIGNLTNLKTLYLCNNAFLSSLPPEIGNLAKLTHLNIKNGFDMLPDSSMTDYEEYDGLRELPPTIGNLAKLIHLDLRCNSLHELPPETGNLAELEYLNLSCNNLTELSPEIGNLAKLTHLDLSDNSLEELPSEIGNLVELTYLGLSGNFLLTELPAEIINLKKLSELTIDGGIKLPSNWDTTQIAISEVKNKLQIDSERGFEDFDDDIPF